VIDLTDMARDRGVRVLDVVGASLILALASWVLLASAATGSDPWPIIALTVGVGAATYSSHLVSRFHATLVPALITIGIAGYLASFGGQVTASLTGPLGYKNAAAALAVVGVGAAGVVVVRARTWPGRLTFLALALALAALPWFSEVTAGRGTGTVVLLAVSLVLTGRVHDQRQIVIGAGAAAMLALATTVVAGVAYQGDGEGDRAGALTERRLVLWSEAAEMIADRPVFGVGRFRDHSPTARADPDASWAHHEPLHLGAETGLVGLILLTGLIVWGFAWLRHAEDHRGAVVAALLLAAAFAHACVDYAWHFPAVALTLGAIIGSATTHDRSSASES
jgi:O-antigen ligase